MVAQRTPAATFQSHADRSINQVDGSFRKIRAGNVSQTGISTFDESDECTVWAEKPSLALASGLVLRYLFTLLLVSLLAQGIGASWIFLVTAVGLAHIGLRLWALRTTHYRMTSQRLEITSGLLTQGTVTYELHQVGEAVIIRPLILRLVNRGNLSISSPFIAMRGIRNPQVVRDLMRSLGQNEAERFDKVRWR